MKCEEVWFLIFDGESSDGRGTPKYVKRTTDVEVAKKHFIEVKRNPYSIGKVKCFVEDEQIHIFNVSDFDRLSKRKF